MMDSLALWCNVNFRITTCFNLEMSGAIDVETGFPEVVVVVVALVTFVTTPAQAAPGGTNLVGRNQVR